MLIGLAFALVVVFINKDWVKVLLRSNSSAEKSDDFALVCSLIRQGQKNLK
jgi:hypothetical protein